MLRSRLRNIANELLEARPCVGMELTLFKLRLLAHVLTFKGSHTDIRRQDYKRGNGCLSSCAWSLCFRPFPTLKQVCKRRYGTSLAFLLLPHKPYFPALASSLAIAVASFLWTITLQTRAVPEDDVFQQAVNYVFTGKIDPGAGPEIVDRKSCVVVVPEKFGGYARYYLTRFKMDDARISNKYSGREVSYELEVAGDDILVEYLKIDKTTVDYGFKSAHISLPGNIDQIKRALQLIFAEYCKADKPKSPF